MPNAHFAVTNHNLTITVSTTANYRFRLDASDPNAPILIVTDLDAAPYGYGTTQSSIYIRGGFNEWGTASEAHYAGGDVYEAVIGIEAGRLRVQGGLGGLGNGQPGRRRIEHLDRSGSALGELADGGGNLAISIAEADEYLFTVDALGGTPQRFGLLPFRPFGATEVFVRGGMNGWGTDNMVVFKGTARYATHIALEAGDYEFKVASEDWSAVNLGAAEGAATQVSAR